MSHFGARKIARHQKDFSALFGALLPDDWVGILRLETKYLLMEVDGGRAELLAGKALLRALREGILHFLTVHGSRKNKGWQEQGSAEWEGKYFLRLQKYLKK